MHSWSALGMETEALVRRRFAAFTQVPDPRRPRGRRHPLAAILALATAAMLGGARSLDAIGQEGDCRSQQWSRR